jgi:ADP-ribosylglycohydrolase
MTLAVASWLMKDPDDLEVLVKEMQFFGNRYPKAGYGGMFRKWLIAEYPKPYNSFGNGSAMRVSPCAWVAKSLDEALTLAKKSAIVTHNHPEGIKGAQAVAAAIWMARNGNTKEEIKAYDDYLEKFPKELGIWDKYAPAWLGGMSKEELKKHKKTQEDTTTVFKGVTVGKLREAGVF